ncbi:MerR family transcriptional regulator [Myxococcus sp. AM009]|uniref:MerR family transcriptional regulator n=1 Tax=unclassified Myxococcus TaxID=2648731 RepID=UPI0015960825|nr:MULTISPECIES: MerR family transcriptional regulator [unclassified Myxococcus]NVI96939.1 MerR family transcriptional regulator [Myxococcus sp. AM009]NVJ14007.1 MerR family transcriptional regulator [Myxococcus sp. AM010]
MSGLLYSIGETSRITGLTVKALRFYQEKGLLEPSRVDPSSGYRYYTERDIALAHTLRALRDLQLSLEEIQGVLAELGRGDSLAEQLARVRARLAEEAASAQRSVLALDTLLRHQAQAEAYLRAPPPLLERRLPPVRVAVHRARGRYSDASVVFPRLFAACGPHVAGAPFCLLHEAEYREHDADLSWCVPLAPGATPAGVSIEELPEVQAVVLVHSGAPDSVGPSWARLFAHLHARERTPTLPLRETYLRVGTTDGTSWLTELALPWEGNGLRSKG